MTRHTQGSLTIVGAIAAGIFLVAFVALMVLGGYGFSAALFLSIVIAAVAAIVLYIGFGGSAALPMPGQKSSKPAAAPKPAEKPVAKAEQPATKPAAATGKASSEVSGTPEKKADTAPAETASTETAPEGTKPATLDKPREGGADNLKEIKGIGPKLEELCNSMGFYHFDQIANWSDEEVAWVDENLQGFKGRVSRDNWVEQAKVLASGGETEFSKRVEGGDVY